MSANRENRRLPALLGRAMQAHQAGDLVTAQTLYARVLQASPRDFRALYCLGVSFCQQGLHSRGAPLIEQALVVQPNHAEAHSNLASALNALSRHDEAISHAEQALALDPALAEAHRNLGIALHALNRQNEARTHFAQAQSCAPNVSAAVDGDQNHPKRARVLYAFYDLDVSPATFDIVVFLVLAELERLESHCESLHLVIVPGTCDGFRPGDLQSYRHLGAPTYSVESLQWRLWSIVVPACRLLPSCGAVSVCATRGEAAVLKKAVCAETFPRDYETNNPIRQYSYRFIFDAVVQGKTVPSLQATRSGLRFVDDWRATNVGGRKLITITLRESPNEKDRNSNISEWVKFAKSLDRDEYFPVFIRDLETAFQCSPPELEGMPVFREASWNLELRMALYELSFLNTGVTNGPMALSLFNAQSRLLVVKVVSESSPAATSQFVKSIGLIPGTHWIHATRFQRMIWEEDTFEAIRRAFDDIVAILPTCFPHMPDAVSSVDTQDPGHRWTTQDRP